MQRATRLTRLTLQGRWMQKTDETNYNQIGLVSKTNYWNQP